MTASTTLNRWILIHELNHGELGLLSIGDTGYAGGSIRKNLDALGRELLLERIRRTVEFSAGRIDEIAEVRGNSYRVIVEPICSPMTKTQVGLLAIFTEPGAEVPPRPPIGSMEWRISPGGAIQTEWDDGMFALYELKRVGAGSPTGDMNQWVNQLIAAEDRPRMKVTIDGSIGEHNGQRYFVQYRIITRGDTDNPGQRSLEVAGSCVPDEDGEAIWLRGIAREIQAITPEMNPAFGDAYTGGLLRATFELVRDKALIALDLSVMQKFMTSPSWHRLGIATPRGGYMPHVVHPEDLRYLEGAGLGRAPFYELTRNAPESINIRLLHADGIYRPYIMRWRHGHSDNDEQPRYVVVAFKPLWQQGVSPERRADSSAPPHTSS